MSNNEKHMGKFFLEIKRNLEKKTTNELCQILDNQNREEWTQEAFVAIREILQDRKELGSNGLTCTKCGSSSFEYDDYWTEHRCKHCGHTEKKLVKLNYNNIVSQPTSPKTDHISQKEILSTRIRRTTFNLIYIPLIIINTTVGVRLSESQEVRLPVLIALLCLSAILFFYFCKGRLNDMDRSGWWLAGFIIPILNIILILELMFISGTRGQNKYGPDPREDVGTNIQRQLVDDDEDSKVKGAGYPLRRFVARAIDISFCGFAISVFTMQPIPPSNNADFLIYNADFLIFPLGANLSFFNIVSPIFIFFIFIVSLIAFEATIIAAYGTTIGKRLCGITVVDTAGKKIHFLKALKRTVYVWVLGLGWSLPVVSFLAPIISYIDLKKHGATRWDRKCECKLFYKKTSKKARWIAVALSFFILFAFINISFVPWIAKLSDKKTYEIAKQVADNMDKSPRLTAAVEVEPGKFRNVVVCCKGSLIWNVYIKSTLIMNSLMFPFAPFIAHYLWGERIVRSIFFV